MTPRRTLVAGVLTAALLAVAPAAGAASELVGDGGFESAVGGDSPAWSEDDSLVDSPLCRPDECFAVGEDREDLPRTGEGWAWFGGLDDAGHTGSIRQVVTIPRGAATLTYWYRDSAVSEPFDATLTVAVDGVAVRTHVEASSADPAYALQTVDLTRFADGGAHTLSFAYLNGAQGLASMLVDDVSIASTPAVVAADCSAVTAARSGLTQAKAAVAKAQKTLTKAKKSGTTAKVRKARKKLAKAKAAQSAAQSALSAAQAAHTGCATP